MSKVLVTGLSGFTGRFLKERLEKDGYHVMGLSHDHDEPANQLYKADLADIDELKCVLANLQPDYIIHLAAIAFVAHGNVDEIYQTNLIGTQHLLTAIDSLQTKPKNIILASSANIYGNATVEPITEDTPFTPANDYAVSKLAMEYMASTWKDKLPISIVRPFNYTGVGQSPNFLLPKIVKHFKEKAAVMELGNLDVVRDFSDVRDVVDAYARLLTTEPNGTAYNICSGKGTSLLEVIEIMKAISGHTLEVRVNPAFVRTNEVKRLIGSNKKLESVIGERKLYSLQETLSWMYNLGEYL